MKCWTVYKHQNLVNGKIYIGITSQKPEDRWRNGAGYYNHKKFYAAILKYGWDNFSHDILYVGLTEAEACQKEKELIKLYNSKNNGYNLTDGGDGTSGYHHTDATKRKISQSQKRNNHQKKTAQINAWNSTHKQNHVEMMKKRWEDDNFKTEMAEKHKKKILCITTGQVFNSVNEAAQYAGISPSGISKCLKGVQKSAGKHPISKIKLQWSYYLSN